MTFGVQPVSSAAGRPASLRRGMSVDTVGQLALALTVLSWTAGLVIGFEAALAILTTLAFAAAVCGVRKPVLGLLGITLLCTLDAITRHLLMTGGLLRWNTLNYWLIIVAVLFGGFAWRANDRQSVLLKLLIGLLAIQLIGSPDVPLGALHLLGIVPVFGLMVYFIRGTEDDRVWLWIALINGTAGALGGLLFNLQSDQLPALNKNAWGYFPLTAMFAIALSFPGFAERAAWCGVNGLLAVINFCWVFLSGSRGDLLIAMVCLVFIVATIRRTQLRVGYVAASVAIVLMVVGSFPDMRERTLFRVAKLLDTEESAESRTSGRSDLLRGGLHIFQDHPLGVGTGGFATTWAGLGYVEGISGFKYGEEMAAHAGWIKVLVENGVIGFMLMAALVGSFAFSGWERKNSAAVRLGLFVTVVLAIAFTATEFQPKGLWLLVAGAATVINRKQMEAAFFASRPTPRWQVVRRAAAPELT